MRLTLSFASMSFPATATLLMIGSCVGPPAPRAVAPAPARPVPAPARPALAAPPAAQLEPADWQYRPISPGTWSYRTDTVGSVAQFGSGAALVTLRCDRAARRIGLIRAGDGQGAMVVRTSYGAATWPATASAGAAPQLVAFRAASDTALDQIAYSRGKWAVETTGQPPLILPAWAEVARVIEDCRG